MLKGIRKKALTGSAAQQVMERVATEAFDRDTAKVREQIEQFGEYVRLKYEQNPENDFFRSMHVRLTKETLLTENMENALRKCMDRDREYLKRTKKEDAATEALRKLLKVEKAEKPEELPKVTLKLKNWWRKQAGIDSKLVTGVILAETSKAVLFQGHADMRQATWCMRCGRELTQPASYTIGFGEECAKKMGVPYPAELNMMSKKEKDACARKLRKVLTSQTVEAWIPKSQIEETFED